MWDDLRNFAMPPSDRIQYNYLTPQDCLGQETLKVKRVMVPWLTTRWRPERDVKRILDDAFEKTHTHFRTDLMVQQDKAIIEAFVSKFNAILGLCERNPATAVQWPAKLNHRNQRLPEIHMLFYHIGEGLRAYDRSLEPV